jgi:uncharacterized protein YceH (UPF0502 family)
LRGSQTLGELRGNGARLHEFSGLEEVETTLNGLITRDEPLVARLPRQPGQKEGRFAHLLSGEIDVETIVEPERAPSRRSGLEEKVEMLAAGGREVERTVRTFQKAIRIGPRIDAD